MAKIKILVVHNNRRKAKQIEKYISKLDYAEVVGRAKNGKDACKKISKLNPEILFTKYKMRDMDGTEIADKFKKQKDKNLSIVKFISDDLSIPINRNVYPDKKDKNKNIIVKEIGAQEIIRVLERYKATKNTL